MHPAATRSLAGGLNLLTYRNGCCVISATGALPVPVIGYFKMGFD